MVMRPPMPSMRLSRRAKIAIAVAGALVVLLILAASLVNVYVNWLWFGEVGLPRRLQQDPRHQDRPVLRLRGS